MLTQHCAVHPGLALWPENQHHVHCWGTRSCDFNCKFWQDSLWTSSINVYGDHTLYHTPLHSYVPNVQQYPHPGGTTLTWVTWVLWQISMSILWDFTLCSFHTHHSQWGSWSNMLAVPRFSMLHTNLHCFSVIREKEDAHQDIHLCALQPTRHRISVGKLQGHYQRYRTPHFLLRVFKGN